MIAPMCKKHTTHCHFCSQCRDFDKALKATLKSYAVPPPHDHPVVVKARVSGWMQKVFVEEEEKKQAG